MKAVCLRDGKLIQSELPQPEPGPGQLLIRVRAAGVTPTELVWYPTSHTKSGSPRQDAVLSHEFSGVVAEGATAFSPGDEVYGLNDWFAEGALAEYCITEPRFVAPKPHTLDHAEAASVPIGALTAWQGLFDRARLTGGERVLIHGGAGAVGVFAIQLARFRGAFVTTTVSAHNADFAIELGADKVIDYRSTRFEEQVSNQDVVFDAVGGDTLQRSWSVLKPDGRMVTIAASSEETQDQRVKAAFFIVEPDGARLAEIGRMLDSGTLRTFVDSRLPLDRAQDAYDGTLPRTGRGKLVIEVR
jgi:NADPH:quinone reductase-like Zn-dependent oxidoreductase